jgi:hypothetical protein
VRATFAIHSAACLIDIGARLTIVKLSAFDELVLK